MRISANSKVFTGTSPEWAQYLLPIVLIFVLTVIFFPGRSYFAKGQWALLYLPAIVFTASIYGIRSSIIASVFAFFTWNYFFLPPFHTFWIDDYKDLLSLIVFLGVGIVVGLQTWKLKEKETQRARIEALNEADRLKSVFISSISHELKTPLSSIMAIISNLLDEDIEWKEGALRNELNEVNKDLKRLNVSINSLVDFSRLESASWYPNKKLYEIGEIIGSVLSRLPEFRRNMIDIRVQEDMPQVYVDFSQISRVLENIIENAFSYGGEGFPIVLSCSRSGKSDILLSLEDRGPGLNADELKQVFKKFYRGRMSGKYPSGTGLGLAIAAEIIKFHKGRIWAENVSPHGTRISFFLPVGGEYESS